MNIEIFSKKKRDKLVSTIFQLRKKMEQVFIDIEDNSDDVSVQVFLMKKLDKTSDELEKIENEYTEGLALQTISRCPFSNEPFNLSIDTFGLDGPWWDAQQPIRAIEEESDTFFAITGSVTIAKELPETPFSIKPGPAIPWVSPRLLKEKKMIAVLSHLKIGDYDAYPIVYYSNDKTVAIERINTWGTDKYLAEDTEGFAILGSTFDEEDEYDFDIASWIEKGKLKWISLDDDSLELHDTIDGCPYINLYGYQYPVLIQNKTSTNCMITLEYEDEEVSDKDANFCTNCGSTLNEDTKFCSNCGYKLN